MYILLCANGKYYTGSTKNLELRLLQHQNGEGAIFTKKHLPVRLVYFEEFQRIDEAFYREKQIQGWSRKKKEALINSNNELLPALSKNYTQYGIKVTETLESRVTELVEAMERESHRDESQHTDVSASSTTSAHEITSIMLGTGLEGRVAELVEVTERGKLQEDCQPTCISRTSMPEVDNKENETSENEK